MRIELPGNTLYQLTSDSSLALSYRLTRVQKFLLPVCDVDVNSSTNDHVIVCTWLNCVHMAQYRNMEDRKSVEKVLQIAGLRQ